MKSEHAKEQRQLAGQMEVFMIIVGAISAVGAVLALFSYGWAPGLTLFILGLIAFALSRVFDLLAALLTSVGKLEESNKSINRSEKGDETGS